MVTIKTLQKKINMARNLISDAVNVIVEGTSVSGDIVSESNIRIDGVLKGNLTSKGRIFIGPKAVITGDVSGDEDVEVEGKAYGAVTVKGVLSLRPTSLIEGDMKVGKIVIEEGASFNGKCIMGETDRGSSSRSFRKHANGEE